MGGQQITGLYGEVFYNSEGAKNGTEAWLRYQPAQMLLACQNDFLQNGYGLVIYDAYRPYSVTLAIRDRFSTFLENRSTRFQNQFFKSMGRGAFLAQSVSAHNYGVALDLTIRSMSTGEELHMPSPMHTLDYRSAYTTWQNKNTVGAENARWLRTVMTSHGFSVLNSEWWHFQDNGTARVKIDIPN